MRSSHDHGMATRKTSTVSERGQIVISQANP